MKHWGNKSIEKELKISKKQNLMERYDYLCSNFNAIDYCVNLERYTNKLKNKLDKENTNLKQALNEIKKVVKGYMPTNQSVFKAMDEIEEIIDKVEE